jgi:MFS family permease
VEVSAGVLDRQHRALTVGVLLIVSLIAFEGMAVATILPVAAAELDGLSWYGWAFSVFVLANLVGAIAGGQVADRRGVLQALPQGLFSFAAGFVVAGLAPYWPILLLGRALQGFGGGSLAALAYVAIARGYPDRLRARMLALLSSAWVLPSLVGPALAGQIAEYLSWRWIFLGLLPLVAIAAILVAPPLRKLGSGRSESAGGHRLALALLVAAGGLVLLYGLGVAAESPLPGVACVGVGLLVTTLALRALLPAGVFTAQPGIPAGAAVRGLLAFSFFGCEALVPLGLVTLRDLTPSLAGVFLSAGALSWVGSSWLQARSDARDEGSGRVRRILVGLLLVIAGIGIVGATIVLPAVPLVVGFIAWSLAGFGMGHAYPAGTVLVLGAATQGEEGLASASLQVSEMVGTAAGTGMGGALLAIALHLDWGAAIGMATTFLLTAIVGGAGIVAARRLVNVREMRAMSFT